MALLALTGPDEAAAMILKGRVLLVPNPCTTRPCRPGVVLAVRGTSASGEEGLWHVVRHGALITDSAGPAGAPAAGAAVRATGVARERFDISGEGCMTLEVETLAADR